MAYNHGASKAKQYGCCYELTEDEARIPYVYHCFKINDAEHTPYVAIALDNPKVDKQLKRLVSSSVRMDGLHCKNNSHNQHTVQPACFNKPIPHT